MSVNEMSLPARREKFAFGNRLLGLLGLIGAPMMLIFFIFGNLDAAAPKTLKDQIMCLTGVFYMGGWMMSAVGMRRLGRQNRFYYSNHAFKLRSAVFRDGSYRLFVRKRRLDFRDCRRRLSAQSPVYERRRNFRGAGKSLAGLAEIRAVYRRRYFAGNSGFDGGRLYPRDWHFLRRYDDNRFRRNRLRRLPAIVKFGLKPLRVCYDKRRRERIL